MAVVLLAALAFLGWPESPAPLGPAEAWSERAAPAVDALALDLASAAGQPGISPVMERRLQGDLRRVESAGRPPDEARAKVWDQTVADVRAALRDASDPGAAGIDIRVASLEISALSGASTPAQPQPIGVTGPNTGVPV